MGISIIDNFNYRAGKPNFERDLFEDVAEMASFPEVYLPPVFECNIKSGDRYRFNVNNDSDPILGKWRLVSTSDSGSIEGYTKDEINAIMETKMDKPEIEGTTGQILSISEEGKNIFIDPPQYDDTELRELIEDIQLGNLSYEIVEQLPDPMLQSIPQDVVYMIDTGENVLNMFLFVDGEFKSLGSTTGGALGEPVEANSVLYSNTTLDTVANVKDCLDAIIEKVYYVAPSITSFTCNPSRTSYELGEKVSSITFNWAYNKPIASQSLTGCTIGVDDRSVVYDVELSSNKTFTLSASDGTNNTSASKSFTFSSKVHSGSASVPDTYDSAFILGLSGTLKGNKSGTYTVNVGANQYFYIAMPSTYNSNADVLVGVVGGFSTEFGRVASFDHTNASGYTCDYNIYKSTNANLGNVSFVV